MKLAESKGASDRATGKLDCMIIVPSLMRAGAETQAVDLANGLAMKGHTVHLCAFEKQLEQRGRVSGAVCFHQLSRRRKVDLSLIKDVAKIIDAEKIDIVQGVLQIASLVAYAGARQSDRKPAVIAAVHTTLSRDWRDELYSRFFYRWLMRRMAAVVFVCDHQREYWIRKFPELVQRAVTIHNGIAQELFRHIDHEEAGLRLRNELGISQKTFVFSCIAAFRPEKGHKLLLDAMVRVQGDVFLLLAGDGELRKRAQAYADEKGIARRTKFLGSIPDTRPLIAASNATILASTAVETFSMAMLESMAMGVPMIAPTIGGLPEAIIHRETGLLFPTSDVDALSQHMQFLVDQPAEAERLGGSAANRVAENFTREKMVTGTEQLMKRLLAQATG